MSELQSDRVHVSIKRTALKRAAVVDGRGSERSDVVLYLNR